MNVSPTTSRDKGTGRDTVVTRTRARSSRRICLGDWVIEDGRADGTAATEQFPRDHIFSGVRPAFSSQFVFFLYRAS